MFLLEMLKFNILAAVIIPVTLLVSRILKNKYSVRWKYWTWLAVAVLLLLPFQFTALRPVIRITVPQETGVQTASVPETEGSGVTEIKDSSSLTAEDISNTASEQTVHVSEELPEKRSSSDSEKYQVSSETIEPGETRDTYNSPSADGQAAALSLPEAEKWFVCIWILGIAFVLVVRLLQYIAVKRKLGKYRYRIAAEEILSIYIQLCRQMGIQNPPVLYLQPDLQSPLLTGLLRPSLYLPKEAYTAVDLELIFLHELHHFQHKDLWYKFFLSIPGIIYWFNPAVALMRREANKDMEAICDSSVIRSLGTSRKTKAYGQLLLQTSMERGFLRQAAMGLNDSVTDFKERIKYMLSAKNRKSGIAVCLVLICSLLLANQLVGCSSAAAESGSDSDSAQTEASAAENISASQISELSAESTSTTESVSTPQTTDLSAESSSTTESVSTSQTAGLTVYETENFSFTVPEIWQDQVTGRIEKGAVAEKLILDWNGHHLATIRVDRTINKNNTGDLLFNRAWHSREENGYHVALWVDNYGYRIHSSNMANVLTEEEKEQLLYLSTGGSITLEESNEWVKSRKTWGQTREKTVAFYNESIVPYIEVKDLSYSPIGTETTYETKYFSFTIPEIWQDQVTGRIEEGVVADRLVLEWKGIPIAWISVCQMEYYVAGDIGSSNVWHSEEENGYCVALGVNNFPYYLPSVDTRAAAESTGGFFTRLSALSNEEKEQLLYLTTGGSFTLEEALSWPQHSETEGQTIIKTSEFYEEYIVPYIEVKEMP